MAKEIVQYSDQQIAEVSAKTGYVPPTVTPGIKFNADKAEGKWYKTTGKLDEAGFPEYEEIVGDSVVMHIITCNRKVIQSGDKATTKVSSGEVGFFDKSVTLTEFGAKEPIARGEYKALQRQHPEFDLYFSRILYVFYEDKPYKFKLSGSKAYSFSDYYKLGDPALAETIVSKGELHTNEQGRKYYMVDFKKGKTIELDIVNKRIDDVNEYLKKFNDSILVAPKKIDEPIIEPETVEVTVDDVPFG